jgi:hypothetical protein
MSCGAGLVTCHGRFSKLLPSRDSQQRGLNPPQSTQGRGAMHARSRPRCGANLGPCSIASTLTAYRYSN